VVGGLLPTAVAVVWNRTAAELHGTALGDVGVLRASGARTVASLDANGPDFVIALWEAALAGLPFCPLNYRMSPEQLPPVVATLHDPLVVGSERHRPLLGGRPVRFRKPVISPGLPALSEPRHPRRTTRAPPCCCSPAAPPQRPRQSSSGTRTFSATFWSQSAPPALATRSSRARPTTWLASTAP
jgi:hypothetical protein